MKKPSPKKGILDIAPYVAGKSVVSGKADIIKLSSNENTLGASKKAVEAYAEAAKTLHRYPDGGASLLKKAIQETLGFPEKNIVTGAGSDEVIAFLVNAFAGEGDEVLYSKHGFLMYKIYTQSAGATPIAAEENNYTTSVDSLLAAVTTRTKIVFVANPNNPTGTYISKTELERLRAGLPSHILLVIDGAYTEYATASDYSDGRDLALTTNNTVMLRTFSKAYGLPSLRLGYGVMNEEIVEILNRVRGPFNVSGPAIAAGVAAMKDQEYIAGCVAHNSKWRDIISNKLKNLGLLVLPSQGNFIAVKFRDAKKANEHLSRAGIIVREIDGYAMPDFLRITIGTDQENEAVISCITEFIQK